MTLRISLQPDPGAGWIQLFHYYMDKWQVTALFQAYKCVCYNPNSKTRHLEKRYAHNLDRWLLRRGEYGR